MIKIFASAGILRGAPLLDNGIVPILQPAIIVRDFDALIFVGDRLLRSIRRRWDGGALGKSGEGEETREDKNSSACDSHENLMGAGIIPLRRRPLRIGVLHRRMVTSGTAVGARHTLQFVIPERRYARNDKTYQVMFDK